MNLAKQNKYEVCIECGESFELGGNCSTLEGILETQISGMCEECFDELFDEDES